MNVKIIVDSTADITPELKSMVTVVPLTVCFGEEEYIDKVTINHREFYDKLAKSDVVPKTSQVTPDKFSEIFKETTKDGSKAVVITLSSRLSGTYQSALIAAEDFPGKIFVIDSKTVTIGTGILAELAVELKEKGFGAEEIANILLKKRENVVLAALLDTLEYLKKGGRISKTAAVAGTLLSIKPVVNICDGEINVSGKGRGAKQGMNLLIKEIEASGEIDFEKPMLFGYTGNDDVNLLKFQQEINEVWKGKFTETKVSQVGSVVGTHAGPGAIAIAFFKK